MIKYDYTIERHETDTLSIYRPKAIPTELPNLVYIEAPNSSGKSTLLNLVALSFGGADHSGINDNLKSRMHTLLTSDYQKVSFDIKINRKDASYIINKEAASDLLFFSVEDQEGRKEYAPDNVQRFFNVVYDIPDNPLDQLNRLTDHIKSEQKNIRMILKDFQAYVQEQLRGAGNAKDKNKLEEKEYLYEKNKERLEEVEHDVKLEKKYVEYVQKYLYLKFFNESKKEKDKLESEIKHLSLGQNKFQKEKDNTTTRLRREMNDDINNCDDIHKEVFSDLKNKFEVSREIFDKFNGIDVMTISEDHHIPRSVEQIINAAVDELEGKKKKISEEVIKKEQILRDLYNLLSRHKSENIVIPGSEKTISDFLNVIQEERDKYKKDIEFNEILDHSVKRIFKLQNLMEGIVKKATRLYELNNNQSNADYDDVIKEQTLENKKSKLEKQKEKYRKYNSMCSKLGLNLNDEEEIKRILDEVRFNEEEKELREIKEHEVDRHVEKISKNYNTLSKELSDLNKQDYYLKKEIESLSILEEHPYQDRQGELKNTIKMLMDLTNRFKQFDDFITDISDKKNIINQNERQSYYDVLFRYVGKKIKTIRHIDVDYEVERIDLIQKQIITSSGKTIHFNDMGTGQSQSAYLIGKLNSLDQNKRHVVLFDEIAMMDKKSLMPVVQRLRELDDDGKLIAAMIVQRSDEQVVVKDLREDF